MPALSKRFAYVIALAWIIIFLLGVVQLLVSNGYSWMSTSPRHGSLIFAIALLMLLFVLSFSQPRVFRGVWIVLLGGTAMSYILIWIFSKEFLVVVSARIVAASCGIYALLWFKKYFSNELH